MNLSAIDLNVLVALDAVLSERNVTRAAARIGRSQPATSHALNRARALFADPLLVRVGGGLELTARARGIAPRIHLLLRELGDVFETHQAFDPRTLNGITLGATDYVGFVLLPYVFRRLREAAPQLHVRVRSVEGPEALAPLAHGVLDLALGTFPRLPAGLHAEALFEDRFVCLRRRRRSAGRAPRLTAKRFAALDHVLVASPDAGRGPVDYALEELGLSRNVAALVPHFLVAPSIVATTDLVLTTGRRVAAQAVKQSSLEMFECPVSLDPFAVSMVWHARSEADSVGVWLRGLVRASSERVVATRR